MKSYEFDQIIAYLISKEYTRKELSQYSIGAIQLLYLSCKEEEK